MALALLALIGAAVAAVTFERPPEGEEKGDLGIAPVTTNRAEARVWRLKAERRGVWASVDASLRWHAPAVDACVRAAAVPPAAAVTAELDVSVNLLGFASVEAQGGADATLAGCIATVLERQQLPLALHEAVRLGYTARWAPDAPSPDPAAPPAPEAVPSTEAFAPRLDDERGFGPIAWGGGSAGHEGLYGSRSREGTSFYTRQADFGARWFGAPLQALEYGLGADGLYVVTLGVTGTSTTWRLREALTARYGPPRWDTRFNAYYWRGERTLLQFLPVPNSEDVVITLLDIGRARASGLADRLPGDRAEPGRPDTDRRMPKIFREE